MCGIDFEKISKISPNKLLEISGIVKPPVDPYLIAEKIGIKVDESLDWDKLTYDGEIYLSKTGCPEIWINPTDHINRRKFTLAHEIGHLVYDVIPNIDKFKDPIKDDYTTLRRGATRDLKEVVANRYAANLLMPETMIIDIGSKILEEYRESEKKEKIPRDLFIKIMAKKFEVSEQAMEIRLKTLNII
ncbi:ImmA/IrrE family metallo-endopeptidase [Hydrogenimonas urashimensis]|uniref:ImmA/IrrE family metallo-endopeptidase n=1 Tax=Hydrogenimonas urashimensis TaxID=2740515 RepID=UPI001914E163|nr:ImmA/IrrE family metallo-endopeptidase [Hydrogenimonas urashimensis]